MSAAALDDAFGAAAAGKVVSVWKRGDGAAAEVKDAEPEAKEADSTSPHVPVLFVHGGRGEHGEVSNEAFLFRLDTLQWSAPIKSPCAACAHGCVALDADTVLLLGGWDGAAVLHEQPYALHADLLEWTEGALTPHKPSPRFAFAMSAAGAAASTKPGSKVGPPVAYLFGGIDLTGTEFGDVVALIRSRSREEGDGV